MNIGIFGANGRMGRRLVEVVLNDHESKLSGAYVRIGSSFIGIDAGDLAGSGQCGVRCEPFEKAQASNIDAMIDFTLPETLSTHLSWCVENKVALVIGTTGLTAEQHHQISEAGKSIPVLWAANFSIGVNVMLSLVRQAARVLESVADIEIIEAHHRHKLDAPSGTAMAIGEAIAGELNRDLTKCAIYGREGIEDPRQRETIGFSTIRGGDIVGEHTALFACEGERLEITHKASTRLTFASGAVNVAKWLKNQRAGSYTMHDYVKSRLG
ncbi:4-hydroxy-tetrahydrodipicolinate reductase [Alteromonas sediminis]|uniref:4-hydroxy-tetrahydrodipicolinate reductase n=1 Tax=Alteromonas sediminis TaxID=2259342 RepID=A0A3N5Y0W1_9ALTE|nr:4-hydroxy-tetrahydrodipicolinate reductase [Alteromonas sediminis]RPJ67152.1 4-hydroxy-tetrahydrodipicolinate reductase [Alteromonas sediminis]